MISNRKTTDLPLSGFRLCRFLYMGDLLLLSNRFRSYCPNAAAGSRLRRQICIYLKRRKAMESVINKLTEIETAASRILEGAANQNKLLDRQQEERTAAFDKELESQTAARLQNIRDTLKSGTDADLDRLREGINRELAAMDDYYNKNHDTLSTEICEKLIRK